MTGWNMKSYILVFTINGFVNKRTNWMPWRCSVRKNPML